MFAALLIFIVGSLIGFMALRTADADLDVEEQMVWGVPVGIIALAWWVFTLSYILGNQYWGIGIGLATSLAGIGYWLSRRSVRRGISYDIRMAKRRLRNWREYVPWLMVLVPWTLYALIVIPSLLYSKDGALIAGWVNVWADWSAHLRSSTFFASSETLSLENPYFAGTTFSYPYLSSYFSAMLQMVGLRTDWSLTWPTLIFFGTLPAVLYIVARRITRSRRAGVWFVYIVLLAGGLGVYYLVKDISNGQYFWQASAYSPHLYTDMRTNGDHTNTGIWFMNFIISELFPQRGFLAGLPIALYIFYSVWMMLEHVSEWPYQRLKKNSMLAGFLLGILPVIHSHSFIALGIALPIIVLATVAKPMISWKQNRELIAHVLRLSGWFVGSMLIGILGIFYFFTTAAGKGAHFLTIIHGWIPEQTMPANFFLFWMRNAGPLIVAFVVAVILLRKEKRLYPLVLAALGLFVVSNIVSFQPWIFDNLKILTYWYIVAAIPVSLMLARLFHRIRLEPVLIAVLLMGAGAADVLSVAVSSQQGIQLADKDSIAFALLVKQATANAPDAVIASSTHNDNPILLLSGRPLYMGYEGWLWTYGIAYDSRLADLRQMYQATPQGLAALKPHGIRYVVLGPHERYQFQPNEAALTRIFSTVVQHGSYRLLEVKPRP